MNSDKLLLQILMLDAGIAPDVQTSGPLHAEDTFGFFYQPLPKTLDELLETLPLDERKAMKRKFRKLWKKAAKRYGHNPKLMKAKGERRYLVKKMLLEDSEK